MSGQVRTWLLRLASAQERFPFVILALGLACAAASFPLISRLSLNSSWTALLPEYKLSVRDLKQLQGRVGGLATLIIGVQSPSKNVEGMQGFARELIPELERLSEYGVRSVEWNVREYANFVSEHRQLYASMEDLTEIRDTLQDVIDREKAKANPFFVNLEDDVAKPEDLIRELREKADAKTEKLDAYPGGFFVHEERDLLAIYLRTDISLGDVVSTERLVERVNALVAQANPTRFAPDLKVDYTGDLIVALEEHDTIVEELTIATSLTMGLCLLWIFMFYRRWRCFPILGLGLLVPVAVTFGIAELTVDHLNASTAFLGSIVIGNGINPMIIWLARYFEERRKGIDVGAALRTAHLDTWLATLTAAVATAIAYASLITTDFRGFRDYGAIGSVGILVCWIATAAYIPALTIASERLRPLVWKKRATELSPFGNAATRFVSRGAKPIVIVAAILTVASLGATVVALSHDPIEYDFRRLRSERDTTTQATELHRRIRQIVPGATSDVAIAMVVNHREQVSGLVKQLEEQRDNHNAPYGRIRTIDNLLPDRQQEKVSLLADVRRLMLEARPYLSEDGQREIDANLPPTEIEALTPQDLPDSVARSYTERDGTRGRIIFVEEKKAPGISTWDGRYLVEWSNALRSVRLPDGSRPPLAGRAPVFADMIEAIWHDGPRTIVLSFLATALLIAFAFRNSRDRTMTIVSLVVGMIWMGGLMTLFKIRLNFLNFVAFPITCGIGVDYGVNIMRRFRLERGQGRSITDAVLEAVGESGGAVILCSFTTLSGYLSLYSSGNLAINSFGAAMTISELSCVLAGVFVIPAYMLWHERRSGAQPSVASAQQRSHEASEPSTRQKSLPADATADPSRVVPVGSRKHRADHPAREACN